jgi:RNA polymerase primary sigma factor
VEFDTSGRLKRLVQIGKTRGYILYHEIDRFLPPGPEAEAHLDSVLTEVAANGIEILEETRAWHAIDSTDQVLHDLDEELDNSSAIKMYLREVMTIPRLTRRDEIELAKRINHGGEGAEDAMRQLIEANLYLVVAIARRRAGPGYGLLELIQEGNVGLMQATEKYEYTREYRFSMYATWWIRRSLMQSKLGN